MKATLNDVTIRYEDAGTGPAILVIHDGTSREIGKLFAPLAGAGYRVVVTHLEELGRRQAADLDLAASSRHAVALLNFLGIGRAVVFGIGLGGLVLLEILDSCPDRVAASSLVIGPATARQIRELASRPEVSAALHQGRSRDLKQALLAVLPAAGKEKTALSSLPQLRGWIESFRSRDLYLSAVHHRSTLLADLSIPPLIIETEEAAGRGRRKSSLAARSWNKIRGVNVHFGALLQFLMPDENEEEEEAYSNR